MTAPSGVAPCHPENNGATYDPNAYSGMAAKNCLAAMASTYRMADGSLLFKRPDDYAPELES